MLRGEILSEKDVDECIERSYAYVVGTEGYINPVGHDDVTEELVEANLGRDEFAKYVYAETMEDLELDGGGIGYVYRCLGSAILLLRLAMRRDSSVDPGGPLSAETLSEDLTVDLIMEGGDADTNAAAACALLGAYLGYSHLPSHWTLGLAHKEWLTAKTYRLAVASGVVAGALEPEDDEAPEGPTGLETAALYARNAMLSAERNKKKADIRQESMVRRRGRFEEIRWRMIRFTRCILRSMRKGYSDHVAPFFYSLSCCSSIYRSRSQFHDTKPRARLRPRLLSILVHVYSNLML